MARNRQHAPAESSAEQPVETSHAAAVRPNRREQLQQRLDFMESVQTMLREVMSQPGGDQKAKKEQALDRLLEMGVTDEREIEYILTRKEGRNGTAFYGFPYSERDQIKDQIETLDLLASKRGSFASRTARNKTDGEIEFP